MQLLDLGDCIRTSLERDMFIESLMEVKRSLKGKKEEVSFEQLLKEGFYAECALVLQQVYAAESYQDPDSFITRVEAMVEAWPEVVLTLPIRPKERLLSRLAAWFKDATGTTVVMKLVYEPSILAGAIVEWKGTYHDLSLKRNLINYFTHKDMRYFLRDSQ